jgi:hypothetical protein
MADAKDFFISYTQSDRAAAEWIGWQLEAAGYSVVLQAWDFQQGQNFVLAMDRASQAAGRTLVVLSPDFLASRFTAPEWAAAFAKDPTGQRGLLLPVRVKPCNPDGLLGQIVYIDLVGARTKDEARQRLLVGVDQARRKPETEPDLPALAPDPQHHPSAPEPAWVADLDAVTEVAASAFWRVLRVLALWLAAAVGFTILLSTAFPGWHDENARGLAGTAALLGAAVALAVEALLRWAAGQRGGHLAAGPKGARR